MADQSTDGNSLTLLRKRKLALESTNIAQLPKEVFSVVEVNEVKVIRFGDELDSEKEVQHNYSRISTVSTKPVTSLVGDKPPSLQEPRNNPQNIRCHRCHKTFLNNDFLNKHVILTSSSLLPCQYCSLTFESLCSRAVHEINHAMVDLQCLQCKICFSEASDIPKHYKTCSNATLNIHSKLYLNLQHIEKCKKMNVVAPIKYVPKTQEPFFNCPMCSFRASQKIILFEHVKECKSLRGLAKTRYICGRCQFSTASKSRFGDHILQLLAHGECPVKQKTKSKLISLEPKIPVPSEGCLKPSIKLIGPVVDATRYHCVICGKTYSSVINLNEHRAIDCKKNVDSRETNVPKIVPLDFFCRFCGDTLQSMKEIRRHQTLCRVHPGTMSNFVACMKCKRVMDSIVMCAEHFSQCHPKFQDVDSDSIVWLDCAKSEDEFVLS